MTSLAPRRRGKPRREEMELPVNIQRAFIARASGANWIQCAEVGETTTENLQSGEIILTLQVTYKQQLNRIWVKVILNLLMQLQSLQSD